jgi:hypothetical protein
VRARLVELNGRKVFVQPGPLHAPRLRVAKLEPRDIAGLYLFAGVATSLSIVRAKERGSTANCRTSSFLEVSL